MKIVSWNVNGLARCRRNGFLKFLADAKPDVLCCQEIKGECPLNVPGYLLFWNPAKRTNYSGTLVLSRRQPLSCQYGLGIDKFDEEGRLNCLLQFDIGKVTGIGVNPFCQYSAGHI